MMSAMPQGQLTSLSNVSEHGSSTSQTDTPEAEIYHVKLAQDEDGRFVATVPELQGAVSDGATKDEAITNVHEAVEAMLESRGQQKVFMLIAAG